MTLPTPPDPAPPAAGQPRGIPSNHRDLRANPAALQFTSAYFDLPSVFIEAMCEWCHRHGIDPLEATVPGVLIRDETARRVYYHAPKPGHDGLHLADDHTADDCHELAYVQLEAPPLPWPPEVARYCYIRDNGDGDIGWVTGLIPDGQVVYAPKGFA